MSSNEISFFQYYFASKGFVDIIYNKEPNRFSLSFDENTSEHNKEWFSRICFELNNYLAKGYKYNRLELSIHTRDKNGSIKVEVETSEPKHNSLFQVTENGDFYLLDEEKRTYSMMPHAPELEEIFQRLNDIAKRQYTKIELG